MEFYALFDADGSPRGFASVLIERGPKDISYLKPTQMENRELVISDFLKLRLMLNRPNLVKDQKTEIVFDILQKSSFDYRLIATLTGISNPKHIELCKTLKNGRWDTSDYSGLVFIEDFCRDFLLRNKSSLDSFMERKRLAQALLSELQSLGISL